jgi:hypothetical protein
MPNTLYLYVTPLNSIVQLTADNGVSMVGIPTTHQGRNDAQAIEVPFDTSGIGSLLRITQDGYSPFEGRAILTTDDGSAFIQIDDFHLTKLSVEPTPPTPPEYSGSPEEIINKVYHSTNADLSTHDGCGKFTEDCCTALHDSNSQWWGHIKKNPGQNQYNGHAVDAIMLASGSGAGIYDIIHDSVSPNATPAFNYKGLADLTLWYYPA